jgi:hypothetical protein
VIELFFLLLDCGDIGKVTLLKGDVSEIVTAN